MKVLVKGVLGCSLAALLLGLSSAPSAHAANKYVANNGIDSSICGGSSSTACRSISQAIANAANGDVIIVGPGRYGDLDDDSNYGTSPGEETGPIGCNCMILVDKAVTIQSRDGASTTVIDGNYNGPNSVSISATGAVFGAKKKGFTVTGGNNGVVITSDGKNVLVTAIVSVGNDNDGFQDNGLQTMFLGNTASENSNDGIISFGVLPSIQNNLARANGGIGIEIQSTGAVVNANVAISNNSDGFRVRGENDSSKLTKNISNGNLADGFRIRNATNIVVSGNSATGNRNFGVNITNLSSAIVVNNNNIFGNAAAAGSLNCGLVNNTPAAVDATDNFWGASVGPNAVEPSDNVCDIDTGVTTATPFATKEFKVKPGAQ